MEGRDIMNNRVCEQCGKEKLDVERVCALKPPGYEAYLCESCRREIVSGEVEPKTKNIREWRDWQWKLLQADVEHRSRMLRMPIVKQDMIEIAEEIRYVRWELQSLNQSLAQIAGLLEIIIQRKLTNIEE